MKTVVMQIGNSDNKLEQQTWSTFCRQLCNVALEYGQIHFSGGSACDAPWQNYAVVVNVNDHLVDLVKRDVVLLRAEYNQGSAAFLVGETQFV